MEALVFETYDPDPAGVLRAAEDLFQGADRRAVGCYGCVVLVLLPVPRRRGRGMTLRQRTAFYRRDFQVLRERVKACLGTRLCALVATGPEEADALCSAWDLAPRPPNVDWAGGHDPGWYAIAPLLEQPHDTGRLLSRP